MKHLQYAINQLDRKKKEFVKLPSAGNKVVIFIQDGVIGEVGVNGIQATDLLEFVQDVFISLNKEFHSSENDETINYIERALEAQTRRTADRVLRGVEGQHKE